MLVIGGKVYYRINWARELVQIIDTEVYSDPIYNIGKCGHPGVISNDKRYTDIESFLRGDNLLGGYEVVVNGMGGAPGKPIIYQNPIGKKDRP